MGMTVPKTWVPGHGVRNLPSTEAPTREFKLRREFQDLLHLKLLRLGRISLPPNADSCNLSLLKTSLQQKHMEKDPNLLHRQQEQAKLPLILVDGLISAPPTAKTTEKQNGSYF